MNLFFGGINYSTAFALFPGLEYIPMLSAGAVYMRDNTQYDRTPLFTTCDEPRVNMTPVNHFHFFTFVYFS